ncbi:MAG: flagellar biosynthetic protein FliQ [Candidatus Dadabacteria bacterium]|nr:MAG: flagellar biosynthetic protein FliQ [Candidatus Dadabacteria bacterium]
MLDNQIYDISIEALRTLYLVGIPILLAITVASLLVSFLQAATTVRDTAISYSVRVLAFVVLMYVMFRAFSGALVSLMQRALTG